MKKTVCIIEIVKTFIKIWKALYYCSDGSLKTTTHNLVIMFTVDF